MFWRRTPTGYFVIESYGMRRRERRALENRWRGERRRSRRCSGTWRGSTTRTRRPAGKLTEHSYLPNEALGGLHKVNADMVSFVQSRSPVTHAATLVETHKQQALYSYRKYRAYQPLTVYWAEAEVIVHSEFRDGNVPAGYQQLRVFTEASSVLWGGQGEAAVGRGGVSRVAAVLRRGQRRALRSDRVCGGR